MFNHWKLYAGFSNLDGFDQMAPPQVTDTTGKEVTNNHFGEYVKHLLISATKFGISNKGTNLTLFVGVQISSGQL
eukprot:scaffold26980_cov130-Amphora_coffeaeformis.AAC.3